MARTRKRTAIELEGEADLSAAIGRVDTATRTASLAAALSGGLAVVATEARRTAPRDEGVLAQNIEGEVNLADPNKAVGRVGPNKRAWHGIFAELGTRHHAPQPYLRPALDSQRDNVVATIGGILRDFIFREV